MREERGGVLVETAVTCVVLVVFFSACVGTWSLVRDKLFLERVARDGAREAVLTGSTGLGEAKARDRAEQLFGGRAGAVEIDLKRADQGTFRMVVCRAEYPKRLVGIGEEVVLSAEAVYGWKDVGE